MSYSSVSKSTDSRSFGTVAGDEEVALRACWTRWLSASRITSVCPTSGTYESVMGTSEQGDEPLGGGGGGAHTVLACAGREPQVGRGSRRACHGKTHEQASQRIGGGHTAAESTARLRQCISQRLQLRRDHRSDHTTLEPRLDVRRCAEAARPRRAHAHGAAAAATCSGDGGSRQSRGWWRMRIGSAVAGDSRQLQPLLWRWV
mmetsp:Transcript_11995/g.39457  ORF Transcript_11995/g.39457 Transcript_11995/m.39457 type:complete len:203 (-) Transcript_11995:103-711(-)